MNTLLTFSKDSHIPQSPRVEMRIFKNRLDYFIFKAIVAENLLTDGTGQFSIN